MSSQEHAATGKPLCWWQPESDFASELSGFLGDVWGQSPALESFVWSGSNTCSERDRAAHRLADRLQALDNAGSRYHIVAHSHGGSVAWEALLLLTRRERSAQGLLSWTTVGTPFLRAKRVERTTDFLIMMSGLIGLGIVPLVPLLALNIHTGDISHWQAPLLLIVTVGMLLLLVLGFCAILLALHYLVDLLTWLQLLKDPEQRVTALAQQRYGGLWTGLWHPHDEAVTGLGLSTSVIPPLTPRAKWLRSGTFERLRLQNMEAGRRASMIDRFLHGPFMWLCVALWPKMVMGILHNRLVAPLGDRFIRSSVRKHSRGQDVPGVTLDAAKTWPGAAPQAAECPSLPNDSQAELESATRQGEPTLAVHARRVLQSLAIEGGASSISFDGYGFQDLIHTRYFQATSIRELIHAPILEAHEIDHAADQSSSCREWREAFKIWRAEHLSPARGDRG